MIKKCIICGKKADYVIKDSNDTYCTECAIECYSDVSFLQKIEEQAQQLKEVVKKKIEEENEDNSEEEQ